LYTLEVNLNFVFTMHMYTYKCNLLIHRTHTHTRHLS